MTSTTPNTMPRLLRQVKIDGKWVKLPVERLLGREKSSIAGKFRWDHVVRKGESIYAPAGTFYIEYKEDDNKVRRAVGSTQKEAVNAMVSQASVIALRARGVTTDDAPEIQCRHQSKPEGKTIAEVVDAFCDKPPLGLRAISLDKYSYDIGSFRDWAKSVGKTHLVQVDRDDIREFMRHIVRDKGLQLKTAINKSVIALKVLRDAGADIRMGKGDWPRVTEEQPPIYTPPQLKPLFAAMLPNEYALYQTFLLTGFRDQEIGFLSWDDFNARAGTLSVTKKAGMMFDPKNYMERTVPVHPNLVDVLLGHRKRQNDGEFLIFPTQRRHVRGRGSLGGKRDKHMLKKLKLIALRAGLNCGRCKGIVEGVKVGCTTHPVCEQWTLHKFRHTYATTLLHEGFDIVTVQRLLGHSKIESTMKYLRMLQPGNLRQRMDGSAIATMFL